MLSRDLGSRENDKINKNLWAARVLSRDSGSREYDKINKNILSAIKSCGHPV